MKIHDLIHYNHKINTLLEYDRGRTVQNFGQKIVAVARLDKTIPQGVRDPNQVSDEQLSDIVMSQIEQIDPTKNKEYAQALARLYGKGGIKFEDMTSTVAEYLAKFHKLKQKKLIPSPRNDFMGYADIGDFFSVVDEYPDPNQAELKDKGTAIELYNDENIRVIVPEDKAAACYYGQGTRWCTAATRGTNYFLAYSTEAPLMIVIPKKPNHPGEKYQLWFFHGMDSNLFTSDDEANDYYEEYRDEYDPEYGQFMDEHDDEVDLRMLMKRFGSSLHNAVVELEKKFPALDYAIQQIYQNEGLV